MHWDLGICNSMRTFDRLSHASQMSNFIPAIRDMTSKVIARGTLVNALASFKDTVSDGTHFLVRAAGMPEFEKVGAVFIT